MSIRVQSYVWETSPAKGSDLLVLLAIADFANDDGTAWPGVETLARKARISKRQAQYCLRNLTTTGLLAIEENAGPKGTHLYRVQGVQNVHGADSARVQSATPRGADSAGGGADFVPKGCNPLHPNRHEPSIEPSRNRQRANTRGSRIPDDFAITDDMRAWAIDRGASAVWIERQTERFVDYWLSVPGAKGLKLDWPATWRTWIGRDLDNIPRNLTHLNGSKPKNGEAASPDEWDEWRRKRGIAPSDTDVIEAKGVYR